MAGFVLDSSATLAAIVPDEADEACVALLARVVEERAVVPSLWPLEVANGLLMSQRRKRISEPYRLQTLNDLERLPVVVDDETSRAAWSEASRLAAHHGLTVYDAAYLELALRLRKPLATRDARLAAAARDENVDIL